MRNTFKAKYFTAIVLSIFFALSGFTSTFADDNILTGTSPDRPNSVPGSELSGKTDQLIVKFETQPTDGDELTAFTAGAVARLNQAAGIKMQFTHRMSGGAMVVKLPSRMADTALQEVINKLSAMSGVESVEADVQVYAAFTPDDPYFPSQWHYADPASGSYGINAQAGWDVTTGTAGITMAVLDTGITSHPELNDRIVPGYDFVSDVMKANDGDGRDNDPSDPGDWVTAEERASGYFAGCIETPSTWHGTHTAGTMGAASNNGVGVSGVNWNSEILPVRVLGKCGGYLSDIIDGMRWAAGLSVEGVPANPNPARVINLSLGGIGSCSSTMQTTINEILAAGTTIVAAAGNNGLNTSSFTPANCEGVITVAATSKNGSRASYSNYGSNVEVSAPGGSSLGYVISTWNNGKTTPGSPAYATMSGTSMAAPHVSGVVSLLYSYNPRLVPAQIMDAIQASATPFPEGSTCTTATCGSGILNMGNALNAIMSSAVDLLSLKAAPGPKAITVKWVTAREADNLGFNVYRSRSKSGVKIPMNKELILTLVPPGSPFGAEYRYRDTTAKPGVLYYYWLEDVALDGTKDMHGPVKAKIQIK